MELKRRRGNSEIFGFYILYLPTPNCDINAVDSVYRPKTTNKRYWLRFMGDVIANGRPTD